VGADHGEEDTPERGTGDARDARPRGVEGDHPLQVIAGRKPMKQHLRSQEEERRCEPITEPEDSEPDHVRPGPARDAGKHQGPSDLEHERSDQHPSQADVLQDMAGDEAGERERQAERRDHDRDDQRGLGLLVGDETHGEADHRRPGPRERRRREHRRQAGYRAERVRLRSSRLCHCPAPRLALDQSDLGVSARRGRI
jgi:hypothetical protein